jgi:hypothetical protein
MSWFFTKKCRVCQGEYHRKAVSEATFEAAVEHSVLHYYSLRGHEFLEMTSCCNECVEDYYRDLDEEKAGTPLCY